MTQLGLTLYDLLKGTHVRKTMRFLEESQHWQSERMKTYQKEKLVNLLKEATTNVPFYKQLYTGHAVEGISNPQGLGDLPVCDRKMTIEANDDLLNEKINLKKCKVGRTGGTTGPPLRIYRDQETRSFSLAAYYRFYDWMGVEAGMREVELWGSTEIRNLNSELRTLNSIQNLKLKTQNYLNNFRSYNAFSFNDTYLAEVVNKQQKFRPKLIRGYLSAILLLADYIKRNNITGIRPIAVSCTSETLFPEYRKMIEEVFQAPLFNQYGCGECNSIAFECKEHNGMHITMEHCILESDEENNLIVTNLDNYSQPFIRYKNGDVGVIDTSPCACGNTAPRITELHGRANENIILKDGSSVNGIFFANLLDQTGFINSNKMLRFQIIQNVAGKIVFKAEVKRPLGFARDKRLENVDLGKLKDALMPFFNKVDISQHQFLNPGPGGKFRYLISNLK